MDKTQTAFEKYLVNGFFNDLENDLKKYSVSLAESASAEDTQNIELYYSLIKDTRAHLEILEKDDGTFLKDFINALIKEDPTGA